MTDFVWPIDIIPSRVEWRMIDNTAAFQSPLSGAVRTVSRPGNRWGVRMYFDNIRTDKRHRIMSVIAALRGRTNRLWISDLSTPLRGSMSAPEMFANSDFSNGTSGWVGFNGVHRVQNGIWRVTATQAAQEIDIYQPVALIQYAPYAARGFYVDGKGSIGATMGPAIDGGTINNYQTTDRGLRTAYGVYTNTGTPSHYPVVLTSSTNWQSGSYFDLHYSSLARCFLVDNGINAYTYSDQIDNAAWTKIGASASANALTAPDGTDFTVGAVR